MTLYLLVYAVGLSVVEATVAYLVAMTVAASMALALLIRKWESVGKASLSRSERRRLFAFSGPLIVNRVLYGSVNSWIPGLIGIFLTASDVAVFEIVLRLRRIAKLPARAIGQAFSPEIPRLIDKEDMAKCENLLYVSQRWILTTTLAIQALFVIAGRELLAVFGEDFTAGYLALTMIGLATVVEGSFDPAGSIILMSGHSLLASLISLVSISITVLGTILLVPQYGILGASLAAAGAAVVVAVMCIMSVYKYHRLKALHLDLLRPVFAGVMAGSACWLIFRNFPIASDILKSILFFSAWLLTYLVGLLLFGLKKYEKQLLQEFSIWFRQKVDRSIEL
jgi:O-antigen/teichoic acid export membrane protein